MSRVLVMMMVGVLLVTAAFLPSEQSSAQSDALRVIVRDADIPGSNNVKYPYIASFGNTVHVAGNPDRKAAHWDKVDVARPGRIGLRSAMPEDNRIMPRLRWQPMPRVGCM